MAGERQSLDRLLATVVDVALRSMREAAHGTCPPELWFGLLRAFDDHAVPLKELPGRLAMSKRAVRHAVTAGVRHRVVREESKMVALTSAGEGARRRWTTDVLAAGEEGLAARVGTREVEGLAAALRRVVGSFDLEWPHLPFTYGTADPSITGGAYRPGSEGPPRIPPGGQDWVAVVRTSPASTDGLGTLALVSQALAAFHACAWADFGCILPISASLTAAFPTGSPASFDDVGVMLQLTGDGRSLLERHAFVSVSGEKPGQIVALTGRGSAARTAYRPAVDGVEAIWRRRSRETRSLRGALEQATAGLDALPLHESALVRNIR